MRIAFAGQIDTPDGRIWVPPTGKPYWIDRTPGRAGPDLTDEEIEKYLMEKQ